MRLFGIDPVEDRFRIRALRATPPGRAARDQERRRVFSSALGQFDELLDAAAAAGPASRPLPLYYAVSQATTAIAAALLPPDRPWRPRSHGLVIAEPDPRWLPETEIRPKRVKPKGQPYTTDSFSMLCDALNEPTLVHRSTISNVSAALPGLDQKPGLGAGRPRALPLAFDRASPHAAFGTITLEGVPASDAGLRRARSYLERYYSRYREGLSLESIEFDPYEPNAARVELGWTSPDGVRRDVRMNATDYLGSRWLLPAINKQRDSLSPFLLWWCLLYAFSDLARYHPAEWTAILDPTNAREAVPIERALTLALSVIPRLVLVALVPSAYA
jgi:hypothetical protein